jgi:hypothetical protein
MEYQDKYDDLLRLLTEEVKIDDRKYNLKEDFQKFYVKGNRTAGKRIRRIMQELKKVSQDVRNDVQNYKSKL